MTIDENKQIIRRVVEECWNPGNADLADELYSSSFVFHTEGDAEMRGPESIKQWLSVLHGAMPDLHYQIDALYGDGDRVAIRYTVHGTHEGDFQGIPATGAKLELTGHMILRVTDGQVSEGWGYWDTLGLMIALGILPPFGGPPPAAEPAGAQAE